MCVAHSDRVWVYRCGGACGFIVTQRDKAAFSAPASIRYGRELGVVMLVFVIGWAYAVVSPIVLVMSAIYFMSSYVVWKWGILYIYVRTYEGGGRIWRTVARCLLMCLLIFTFFTLCVFVAKQAYFQAAIMFVTLPLIIIIFGCDPLTVYQPLF